MTRARPAPAPVQPRSQALEDLVGGAAVVVGRRGAPEWYAYSESPAAGRSRGSMKETPLPLTVSATSSLGRSGFSASREPSARANARRRRCRRSAPPPSRRPAFAHQVAEVAHLVDPRVRLQLVVVDDDGDLAQPPVGGGGQRLPELALLQLAVAGHHEHAPGGPPRGRPARTPWPWRRPCRASRCW